MRPLEQYRFVHDGPQRESGWDGCSWIGLGRDLSPFDPPSGAGPIDSVALAMKPAPYLRRAFTLISPVVSARLYVTALGIYRVSVNGVPAGDNVLARDGPITRSGSFTRPMTSRTCSSKARTAMGAIVADGWACGFFGFDRKHSGAHYAREPQLLAQLVVRSRTRSADSDRGGTWTSSTGRTVYSDLLMGEGNDPARSPRAGTAPASDAAACCRRVP